MKNFKDVISTICGLIVAICGSLLAASFAASFPEWLQITLGVLVAAATGILGYFQGKRADGRSKTESQVKKNIGLEP